MAMNARRVPLRSPRTSGGFSLVELMVASAVGLFVALAVTSALVSSGRQFSILGGTATAQNNAQIGLAAIDAAARNAGAGFYSNSQPICPTWNAFNGTVRIANGERFMPVRIVDGGNDRASDIIVFTGGSGSGALTAAPVMTSTNGAANVRVTNTGTLGKGDYAVIGAPGSGQPCTLFQVTDNPSDETSCGGNASGCAMLIRAPNTGLNPNPTLFDVRPTYAFANSASPVAYGPAVVSRVGSVADGFRQDAFAVQCNALVRYNAFKTTALPACSDSPLSFDGEVDALAADVVQMHAQYGLSNDATSDVVTTWENASGATWGGTPSQANIARIKAVRVVLVARSREADVAVTAECTNGAGVANKGPCSFDDASAPVIDLTDVKVPAGRSWQDYRYRVHMAVLPLRTVIWSD
jgi:type IV pilus assembly protein PilW